MTALENILEKAVAECIGHPGLFLVDLSVKGTSGQQKIMVYIDGDQPVGIDECAGISHKLSDMIESNEWVKDNYTLEVSSPGASKPLKFLRQYHKHTGRELEVTTRQGDKITGRLVNVAGDEIFLTAGETGGKKKKVTEEIRIAFSEITSTKVLIKI